MQTSSENDNVTAGFRGTVIDRLTVHADRPKSSQHKSLQYDASMLKTWTAVVTFPTELPLLPAALGTEFEGQIDSGRFKFVVPTAAPGPLFPAQPLLLPLESAFVQTYGGGPGAWGHLESSMPESSSDPIIARVSRVVLEIETESGDSDDLPGFADTFGKQFNDWFGMAIAWLELWNGVNLTNLEKSHAGTVGTIGPPDGIGVASGWSPVHRIYTASASCAISEKTLRSAFKKATALELPPAEWMLYLQGAKTFDNRLAIIDAATAVEVGLAGAIHRRLASLALEAREEIVLKANGLAGMAQLLKKLDGPKDGIARNRIDQRLAIPRNNAVHGGRPPEQEEVHQAFVVARELLRLYSPLPVE